MEAWCTEYGQAQGGEVGKLAAKYLYNVTTTGLGEVLPATLAFPPMIAPVATAYALYQIYDSMADLGGAVLAAKVSQSLRPFDWSQPTLSQADRVFPTDAITKTTPNWDGAAAGTRPVQVPGGQPVAAPHVTSPASVQSIPGGGSSSLPQPIATPAGAGTTPSMPTWQPTHGKALGQLEQLAGQRIEEVPVPDVGSGTPADATTPGTPEQMQQSPGQQMNGSQGGQASTSGANTQTQTARTPQSGTYTATEAPSSMTETTSTPTTQSGTPSATGYGDRAPQYTEVGQSTPNNSADAINNMFNNAGAIEQGGPAFRRAHRSRTRHPPQKAVLQMSPRHRHQVELILCWWDWVLAEP